ncbi:MAG TPA: hypothetical protein VNL94_06545, partial [Candidatus Binatia bacterium]|nr:hypothetical protein [Candidatus Binatia bacterium]
MIPALQADPDCARPGAVSSSGSTGAPAGNPEAAPSRTLRAERVAFEDVDPATWDGLVRLNPYATPFSRWAFHRAWWDAYGENAVPDTLRIVDAAAGTAAP